ncbi:protein CUP-SHAPED COTYLEDON 3-like [Rutidosis leptorrhynchoides]|uniref:protein CUP-SHAPED COTYLEDON 3-like n=1 Tax=Rutidosis leptorrhynchoides TaxID=125765 RepID=UPI003A98FC55
MGLRDIGASLPPGFRFYPSDDELVCHYLYKKISNEDVLKGTLVEIDLHTCEPWQLPEMAKLNSSEWYFFSFRDRKYATGYRTNRATTSGYWKATGKDRTIVDPKTGMVVGMRKTLVFYKNRAPNGVKTGWIMHEFRLESPNIPPKEDWVLCRVFYKAKGDNSNEHCPQDMYHNTIHDDVTSLNLDTSPTLTTGCQACVHHHNPATTANHHSSTTASNKTPPPPVHQNYFGISPQQCNHQNSVLNLEDANLKESLTEIIVSSNNKCKDQFGLFYDMGFEDYVPINTLQDMEFDDDETDNGIVFFE